MKTNISGIGVAGIILGIFEIFYTIAIHNKKGMGSKKKIHRKFRRIECLSTALQTRLAARHDVVEFHASCVYLWVALS